jgi:hypothetical protein
MIMMFYNVRVQHNIVCNNLSVFTRVQLKEVHAVNPCIKERKISPLAVEGRQSAIDQHKY